MIVEALLDKGFRAWLRNHDPCGHESEEAVALANEAYLAGKFATEAKLDVWKYEFRRSHSDEIEHLNRTIEHLERRLRTAEAG